MMQFTVKSNNPVFFHFSRFILFLLTEKQKLGCHLKYTSLQYSSDFPDFDHHRLTTLSPHCLWLRDTIPWII